MRYLLFFALLTVYACTSGERAASEMPSELAGSYEGELPCADCDYIDYVVTFNADNTYSDTIVYVGRSTERLTTSGNFVIDSDGIITTNRNSDGMNKFRSHPQGVLMLDRNGDEIIGETALRYILRPVGSESSAAGSEGSGDSDDDASSIVPSGGDAMSPDNEMKQSRINRHIARHEEGTNFFAYGTEPFWNLKIDYDRGMTLSTLDGFTLNTTLGTPYTAEDGLLRRYTSVTEGGEMIVELLSEPCTDQMLGQKFEYTVSVKARTTVEKEFRSYRGCGEYVIDPRLHNIWVITEFEGQEINSQEMKRGIPQLEISVRDDTYTGHDGCNSIRGGMRVEMDTISFLSGPTTLMACPGDLSNSISLALVEKPYVFEFVPRGLLLKDGEAVRFKLRNVD